MPFRITWEQRPNAMGLAERVAMLEGPGERAEVWPALGFNAYRWNVAGQEILYASPQLFEANQPTRSGVPVLFPFPNRIRAGSYAWDGKKYQLATIDPAGKNAIHGFACRASWRVADAGADADSAWVTGVFQGSVNDPASLKQWPADYRLTVTYRLRERRLRVEATAKNPGPDPLPFGLGYHPYFNLAAFGGEEATVTAYAERYWELHDSLPTGQRLPVDGPRDLRQGRQVAGLVLDDVLTELRPRDDPRSDLRRVGSVAHPDGKPVLSLLVSPDFRDLVAFTAPHREAVCLEPYTCTTDAINLQQAGIEAGWRVLPPGESWRGDVEFAVE